MLPFLEMVYGFCMCSFSCEIGQRITDAFEPNEKILGELDWYSFPLELQRNLPIIWAVAQKPVALKCFGRIKCSRDSLKKVVLLS